MKRIIICALLGLVLTAAFSWTARAKQIRELSKPVTELFTISSPVYEGETVANYNMSFPAEYLEGGQRLYFGVRDERNFHAVLRDRKSVV